MEGFSGDLELTTIANVLVNMSADMDFMDYEDDFGNVISAITVELEKLHNAKSPLCQVLETIASSNIELLDSFVSTNV